MANYKSLEAYKMYESGWVQTIYHLVTQTGVTVLMAKCTPSYRVNNDVYTPWVAISPGGYILGAFDTCKAG